ncbi:endonuclease/exonuclease/phosphatase family protein [Haemophilus parainfluenzae]|uniref:endonuclease/exonuclease/phosphatase family protein n=1 Tax=Haemophilus parainfluenzae TaxID=729 RepID=UPI0018A55F47|nr:endonuclease/exonuclease/phosphatase family protein [Haemophilus parainfluenzae]QOR09371.1 endonuclease/exonuclease/phosphatase family protein [Haemophilus parainfluenzae]
MKQINRFLKIGLVLAILGAGYFFTNLTIFDRTLIQLNTSQKTSYIPFKNKLNMQCDKADDLVPKLAASRFHLITWNVHKGQDTGWQEDLERLSKQADFVLLQEATQHQNLSIFSTALFVSSFSFKDLLSGVKTFTQTQPEWYCGGGVAEPIIQIPKVASIMNLPLEKGNSLLIINVHLINFEWGISAYQAQLEQLFSFVENHQGPIIMAGDFNAWNEERLNLVNNLIKKYGLNSVALSQDERVRFLGYPLDYIFMRGVKVVSATSEVVTSSDHNPLLMEFELE